jgi:sodium transport system ATP-binding protein
VRQLIREMRDQGRCILFSSHIMAEVEALCDRLVVIAEGRVVAEGTPAELRQMTGQRDLEEVFLRAVAGGERAETMAEAAQ